MFICLWIFSRSSFEDPIFFYYKLLCSLNIILLIRNPLYFPWINTYVAIVYQIYYTTVSFFLYHLEDVLQMGILLHKMKHFSSFVKKYFKAGPQLISFIFFLICFLIEIPLGFSLKVSSMGNYFCNNFYDVKQTCSFYSASPSDFSQTRFGQICYH